MLAWCTSGIRQFNWVLYRVPTPPTSMGSPGAIECGFHHQQSIVFEFFNFVKGKIINTRQSPRISRKPIKSALHYKLSPIRDGTWHAEKSNQAWQTKSLHGDINGHQEFHKKKTSHASSKRGPDELLRGSLQVSMESRVGLHYHN